MCEAGELRPGEEVKCCVGGGAACVGACVARCRGGLLMW